MPLNRNNFMISMRLKKSEIINKYCNNLLTINDTDCVILFILKKMSLITASKPNEKRRYFIVLNDDGSCKSKFPFLSNAEKQQY